MAKQKKLKTKLLWGLAAISASFLAINTLIPFFVSAQSSTVGQEVVTTSGALSILCGLDSTTLQIDPVEINSSDTYFPSYYLNPVTPYSSLALCDGTGITIEDTRYSGGFELQMNATDYTDPTATYDIDVTNLSFLTEQANTSYQEDAIGTSSFLGTDPGPLANSNADEAELEYTLPGTFDFSFYGTTYTSVFLCSNGIINFSDGDANPTTDTDSDCTPASGTVFEDPGPTPHIMPYYKDLDTTSGGIYVAVDPADPKTWVRFRWKGTPFGSAELVEFEVTLSDNNSISYDYADITKLTDTGTGPKIGVTKGGTAGTVTSATYTQSENNGLVSSNLVDVESIFRPGFDFTEIRKPGSPAAIATFNGDQSLAVDYEAFIDTDDNGTSDAFNIIDGTVTTDTGPPVYTPGRIGLYTIFPSFLIQIPNATTEAIYSNTITFTLIDSTL